MVMEENNRLIAEFMGGKLRGRYISFISNKGTFPKLLRKDKNGEEYIQEDYYWIDSMPFNTSWDWLMPVVEKIEMMKFPTLSSTVSPDYGQVQIKELYLHEKNVWFGGVSIVLTTNRIGESVTATTKIEAKYKAVLQFIEWYNKTK